MRKLLLDLEGLCEIIEAGLPVVYPEWNGLKATLALNAVKPKDGTIVEIIELEQ